MRALRLLLLSSVFLGALTAWERGSRAVGTELPGPSAVEIVIERVGRQGVLALDDGSRLCLSGIWVPGAFEEDGATDGWRSGWRRAVQERAYFRQTDERGRQDRYGCPLAIVEDRDGASLQHALLAQGWAAVDPLSAPEEPGAVDALLSLEERARRAGLGIWASPAARPKRAADLSAWVGSRQIVEGRVRRVSANERYVYLNFGADWRTDFTIRLRRKMVEAAGFDTAGLDGRTVRARGFLQESRGPLMDIIHLKQIELLP